MIIQLDDYFIRVLQKSGYELDYNKLVKINEKAMSERKKSLNEYNELVSSAFFELKNGAIRRKCCY